MVDGPVTKRRFKRRTIRNAIIGGVVVIILSVVVGVSWKVFSKVSASAEEKEIAAIENRARELATNVETQYNQIAKPIKELAKQNATVQLFNEADETTLEQAAQDNQTNIPHILKLRYLLPGKYKLDTSSNPPLSYASLDQLKKAENTSQINAEVVLLGTPKEHIVIIERVVNKSFELVGLIHASLSVDLLKELVKGVDLKQGYLELTQRASGKTLVLAKAGNAGYKQGQGVTVSVKDTDWVVHYWTTDGAAVASESTSEGGLPLIPIAVVVVFVLLALFFLMSFMKKKGGSAGKKGKAKEDSHITFEGAVRAIVDGAHEGVNKWIPHLPKSSGKTTSEAKPISQGMQGDDITTIAKPTKAATEQAASKTAKPKADKPKAAVPEKPAAKPAAEAKPKAEAPEPVAEPKAAAASGSAEIDPVIFRTYDIRGVVDDTLSAEIVTLVGKALGTMASERGQKTFTVGRDGRQSGPKLSEALIEGLLSTGCDVIDIGMVPTPVLYFSTYHLKTNSGVMVTGSHNPPEYNGLKMMLAGNTLSGDDIQDIRQRIAKGEFATGRGQLSHQDVNADYIRRIADDIPVALGSSLKVVVDCGNGVAGVLAPQLLNAIGHDVIEMYCEIDGTFPNHHPDPSQPENMQELIERVKAESADVGFAFDGDGDRLGIVDAEGNIIWPDRQMMLLAKDVLSRNPGAPIIYDVKCSRYLKTTIEENGGKPLMWKTGHSLIKGKMKEVEAPLAGEMSGHIFFKERWYGFDDALYTSARFIEIFTNAKRKPTELFNELPDGVSTPELRMPMPESEHGSFMSALIQTMQDTAGGEVSDIDGVRIEYEDGWGLARPSNTSPNIILRFEGENEAALERIKGVFKEAVQSVKTDAQLPF